MIRVLIILLILPLLSIAQSSGTLKVKKPQVITIKAIASPSNTLYSPMENYIEVILPKGNHDDFDYRFSLGRILPETRNNYMLVIPFRAGIAMFEIYARGKIAGGNSGKTKLPIAVQEFIVEETPNPSPSWNGLTGGRVERWQLDGTAEVKLAYKDVDYQATEAWSKVISFTFTIKSAGPRQEFKASGNRLTPEMRSALTKVKAGDEIIIWNIRTTGLKIQRLVRPINLEIF